VLADVSSTVDFLKEELPLPIRGKRAEGRTID